MGYRLLGNSGTLDFEAISEVSAIQSHINYEEASVSSRKPTLI